MRIPPARRVFAPHRGRLPENPATGSLVWSANRHASSAARTHRAVVVGRLTHHAGPRLPACGAACGRAALVSPGGAEHCLLEPMPSFIARHDSLPWASSASSAIISCLGASSYGFWSLNSILRAEKLSSLWGVCPTHLNLCCLRGYIFPRVVEPPHPPRSFPLSERGSSRSTHSSNVAVGFHATFL